MVLITFLQFQQNQNSNELNNSKNFILWNNNSKSKIDFQLKQKDDLMWYNLIFIELNFNINSKINFFNNFLDFFFHDEFLWERKNHDSNYIKEFSIELIKSKVIKNGFEYEKGIESLTKDCLDCKNFYFLIN